MQSQRQLPSGVLQTTPQERQALQLLANGDTPNEVAAGLGISALETDALLTKLLAALGAATRAEAVASAQRRGLLTTEPMASVAAGR